MLGHDAHIIMSRLKGLEEEANETEYDESLLLIELERKVEEVKMLSEVKEPLLDLENFSLHELISMLQKFASDPSINVNKQVLVLMLLIMF